MCASALRQLNIHSVYFGCANERFGGTGVCSRSTPSKHIIFKSLRSTLLRGQFSRDFDRPFAARGGWLREEAIMLLRQFYVQENQKGWFYSARNHRILSDSPAPDPRVKKSRELKTEIAPVTLNAVMQGTTI